MRPAPPPPVMPTDFDIEDNIDEGPEDYEEPEEEYEEYPEQINSALPVSASAI